MENKGSNLGAILTTFLIGAAAGAAIGILYAPDTGKNTRDKLAFQIDKLREKLQEILKDMLKKETHEENSAKTEGEKVVTETVMQVEKLISEVDALQTKLKSSK